MTLQTSLIGRQHCVRVSVCVCVLVYVHICVCALGSSCLLDLTAINLAIDVAEGSKHKFDSISSELLLPLSSPLLPLPLLALTPPLLALP